MQKKALLFGVILGLLSACSEEPQKTEPLDLSPQEKYYLAKYVSLCWHNDDLAAPTVRIYVSFRENKHIQDIHVIPEEFELYENDEIYRRAANEALRAIKECDPFEFLPAEKYEVWESMVLTLDPRKPPL